MSYMKKFLSIILICFIISFCFIFVSCNKEDKQTSDTVSNSSEAEVIIENNREIKCEAYNDFENIEYNFEENYIKLKLVEDNNKNVLSFSARTYYKNSLENTQIINCKITNEQDIEIVNFKFTNIYLKFNKTGEYILTITDNLELLTKNITIIVE